MLKQCVLKSMRRILALSGMRIRGIPRHPCRVPYDGLFHREESIAA